MRKIKTSGSSFLCLLIICIMKWNEKNSTSIHSQSLTTILIWASKISFGLVLFSKPLAQLGLCFEKSNVKTHSVYCKNNIVVGVTILVFFKWSKLSLCKQLYKGDANFFIFLEHLISWHSNWIIADNKRSTSPFHCLVLVGCMNRL